MNDVAHLISVLENEVEKMFKPDLSGHNIGHLRRSLANALELQMIEGGDREVIAVSAFIHDVHRLMQQVGGRYVKPVESLSVIKTLIADLPLTVEQKQHIVHCVEHHEEYNFGKEKVSVTDIETLILQDADNLDAIGAHGLVRVLKYGESVRRPVYDSSIPLYLNEYSESEGVIDTSTVHHIHNKLLRLGEHMNTAAARKLAEPRTKFLRDFIDMYIAESNMTKDCKTSLSVQGKANVRQAE